MLDEFRVKLQKDLELTEPLGSEGSESFSLLFDDTAITIKELLPGFSITATLGAIPSEYQELFFSKLLRANLFFQATAGAVLGLDETGSELTLQYLHPVKASYRDFSAALEDFMNTVDFWKKEMAEHSTNPTANY